MMLMSPRLKHTCDDNQIQTLCLMQSINFTAVRQVNFVIALMEGCPSFRAFFFTLPYLCLISGMLIQLAAATAANGTNRPIRGEMCYSRREGT